MARWSNYWRIVQPATRKQLYTTVTTDAYDPRTTDLTSMSTISWYSQILRGPGSRMGAYRQYDAMDNDIDIARALDVIAEEMTNKNEKTNLNFDIEYLKEDNEDVSNSTVVTLRAALREWARAQELGMRLFKIARTMVKYGDCFFRKTSDTKKWVYVDPAMVYGIEVDQNGNAVNYHLKKPHAGAPHLNAPNQQVEIIPAAAMIHFTMCDDMGDSAPFGTSVLRPVFRVYRQLSMLEDAVIIYRIVRAPERRVFYIDTGNMPPQKVRAYLEQVKNELRQKRVPGSSQAGNLDVVDGQMDPAMLQADYFFPVTAAGKGSRVETLPGGAEDFGTNLLKYFTDKIFRGLRIPMSYMTATEGAPQAYNDGKVGVAYIEELRFANYVRRLQDRLEPIFDREFKIYMKVCGLVIDEDLYRIRIPDPANFGLYRQAALDADLISSFNNIEGVKYLARRFILKRYLGLTDDEIQMNEVLLTEERNLRETPEVSLMQQIYDEAVYGSRESITIDKADAGGDAGGGDLFGTDQATPIESGDQLGGGDLFGASSDKPEEAPAEPAAPEAPPEGEPPQDQPK